MKLRLIKPSEVLSPLMTVSPFLDIHDHAQLILLKTSFTNSADVKAGRAYLLRDAAST